MIAIFNFSDYNLTRTVSACVAAQQQTSVSFNYEKAEKYCEEKNQKGKRVKIILKKPLYYHHQQ